MLRQRASRETTTSLSDTTKLRWPAAARLSKRSENTNDSGAREPAGDQSRRNTHCSISRRLRAYGWSGLRLGGTDVSFWPC
jgi:hypothetical protein